MKVLVTGGSGRLGQAVVSHLHSLGHEVVSVDRRPEHSFPATIRQIHADLSTPGEAWSIISSERPEAVIHLAAIAIPFSAAESEIYRTNVITTFSVLEAATGCGVQMVLTATSPTAIGYGAPGGWKPDYLPIDEAHPLYPWNAYAQSKATMEDIVRLFVRSHGKTTRCHAFRPCYLISPEEWAGEPTQLGHTVLERLDDPSLAAVSIFNYVDVRDAASFVAAWLTAAPELPNGEVFFVGADDALSREPLNTLVPKFFPGTESLAAGLTGHSPAFSSEKAKALTGWAPKHSWRSEMKGEKE
ncbi:MAG: NAD-dependent epimerase/dehydratase family protein [Leucobacter sp.]